MNVWVMNEYVDKKVDAWMKKLVIMCLFTVAVSFALQWVVQATREVLTELVRERLAAARREVSERQGKRELDGRDVNRLDN